MVNNAEGTTMVEDRLTALEARTSVLEGELRALTANGERRRDFARPTPAPPPGPASAPARAAAGPAPRGAARAGFIRRPRPEVDLEDFLGGSVLAWAGGAAVVTGLAFLLTLAISRGWLGEGARTLLAGGLSLALLGLGARLRERRGRNDAALSAAAAGVAGLFGTLVVAGEVYALVPVLAALAGALGVGGVATALAIRWRAQVMGWLGLAGALLAPMALGAVDGAGIAFLAVAYGATVGVLVWQRWTALGLAAFGIATPQWIFWLLADRPAAPAGLAALVVFGALTTLAAVGFQLRARENEIRKAAAALLALNAVVLDAAGWWYLHDAAGSFAANGWLVAVATLHVAIGLAGTRLPRVSRALALATLGLGVLLSDVAFAALTSGLPLVAGWVAGAIGFGALLRRTTVPADEARASGLARPRVTDAAAERRFAVAGLGGHLLSALVHAVVIDVPAGGTTSADGLMAVAAVGIGAAVSARLVADEDARWRAGLDVLALAMLAYLSALALDGAVLTAALAGEAVALAAIARREGDDVAGYAAVVFLGAALAHALAVPAPPTALIDGLGAPLAAAAALAAVAGAAALMARVLPAPLGAADGDRARGALVDGAGRPLYTVAALTGLYLASVEVVTAAGPHLTGQTLLSVLWAVAGVGALVAGLVRDDRPLRYGAFALLAVTASKVMVYDLASLTSLYRVGSLIGLGLLLLLGGLAWQRVRPLPLPDLRQAGADAR